MDFKNDRNEQDDNQNQLLLNYASRIASLANFGLMLSTEHSNYDKKNSSDLFAYQPETSNMYLGGANFQKWRMTIFNFSKRQQYKMRSLIEKRS